MAKQPCVYILTNKRNGTLYVGVTSNLARRIQEHRQSPVMSFTARYGIKTLVWYETHDEMQSAITREKQIKEWCRWWKLSLIERKNPQWRDLSEELG